MNKGKLTALCHKKSEETGLAFNSILIYYFLESILKKISKSQYRENFIFKGGFLLSNVVGIESRTTMDMDFLLQGQELSKEAMEQIFKESLVEEKTDDILYEVQEIERIKEEDKYGGFRCKILCTLENIRQIVPLDIATGDIITPQPIDYRYMSSFGKDEIIIKAYPLETMLAEKIETIYSRGFLNSRSKDYYNLYILYKLKNKEIDGRVLKDACRRTFHYRKTEFNVDKIIALLEELKSDERFLNNWKAYSSKNSYTKGVTFEDVVKNGIKLVEKMYIEGISNVGVALCSPKDQE